MRRDTVLNHIIRPALQLLPEEMRSPQAELMLLAIGYQESKFVFRRQMNGPARGFWQFEAGGVKGVMDHYTVGREAETLVNEFKWPRGPSTIQQGLEFGDTMACCFARLLLWTDHAPLPDLNDSDQREHGWLVYKRCWRPGKPHEDMWQSSITYALR